MLSYDGPPRKRRKSTTSVLSIDHPPSSSPSDQCPPAPCPSPKKPLPLLRGVRRDPHRASTACETCRLKKVKCNEGQPACSFCQRHGFRCDYRQSSGPTRDPSVSFLLQRIAQLEEKLDVLSTLPSSSSDGRQANANQLGNNGDPTPSAVSPSMVLPISSLLTPASQDDTVSVLDSPTLPHYTPASYPLRSIPATFDNRSHVPDESKKRSRYIPDTLIAREERRPPFPDMLAQYKLPELKNIMPLVMLFFERVCPLYPIICDQVMFDIASSAAKGGLPDDIETCLTLLVIALAQSYDERASIERGLPHFQKAVQLLSKLTVEFTLEFAQAQVLAAIFMLKKGRILAFWSYLYAGCATLYMMIQRDKSLKVNRSEEESKTILRLYWICLNLERDLTLEINTLPKSQLPQLEHSLPLPLGCDEPNTAHLPKHTRTIYTFFLAEMSLKAILARIMGTPSLEFCLHETPGNGFEVSLVIQELKNQLGLWIETLPTFLEWSPEPGRGSASQVGTRLKLTYWFTLFSLFRPLVLHILDDTKRQFPLPVWTLFQDGLLAGFSMIRVFLSEEHEVDVIMGHRLLMAIRLVQNALRKGCSPGLHDREATEILEQGLDRLWTQLEAKSEWISGQLRMPQ